MVENNITMVQKARMEAYQVSQHLIVLLGNDNLFSLVSPVLVIVGNLNINLFWLVTFLSVELYGFYMIIKAD